MPLIHTDHDYRFKSRLMLDTELVMYNMAVGESFWKYDNGKIQTYLRFSDKMWKLYVDGVYVEPITNLQDLGFTYVG